MSVFGNFFNWLKTLNTKPVVPIIAPQTVVAATIVPQTVSSDTVGDPALDAAIKLIIEFEQSGKCAYNVYADPVGVWTQGYGSVWKWSDDGSSKVRVTMNDPAIDEATARKWLGFELAGCISAIDSHVTVPLTANQKGALIDFCYNLGVNSLTSSTLLKLLNNGDYAGASAQFQYWNHANNQVLPGLTRRRAAERDLFNTP